MTSPDWKPRPGVKAMATLGPDYAPNDHIEVEIIQNIGPDLWLCQDASGKMLHIRTRKLSKPAQTHVIDEN